VIVVEHDVDAIRAAGHPATVVLIVTNHAKFPNVTPIATGENLYRKHGYRELIEKQACRIVTPDIPKMGGLAEAKRVADHAGRIAERLTDLQHSHLERVVTTTHVHLDERRCLEVILLRGPAGTVRKLADALIGTKGVETGRLVLTAVGSVAHREDSTTGHRHHNEQARPHRHGKRGHDHPHPHPRGHD